MEQMQEIIDKLNLAAKAYYMDNTEIMTNLEYDALYDRLAELESTTGTVLPESPTRKVGYQILESLGKVPHDSRMLSLDKTKEIDKLKSFLGNREGVMSWKLDGLTIVLKYDTGKLIQAITRGNGEIGEDVTHNAAHFQGVPGEIPYRHPLTLRGEAVISYSEFERINSNMEDAEKYKNPRNLCSGTVRQLDSAILKNRNVEYYVFTVFGETLEEYGGSKAKSLDWVAEQGFRPVNYRKVTQDTLEEGVTYFKNAVVNYDLPSDGLVLMFDSISYSASLGATSKFPKDSIAFKWEDEIKETKLLDIIWNTSRTGLINPIAVFEPVELEGTTVNRAGLHNLSIVKGLKLGIGDTIKVYKANMIIPQVAENLTESNTFEIPAACNVCNEDTEIIAQNDVEVLYCPNPNCRAQQVKALTHFVSRDAMNIEGFSESSIQKFVGKGFIKNYLDIYSLSAYAEEIKVMEGFGEKSCANLMSSIEKSKVCPLANFIYALGINNIGLQTSKLMCRYYNDDAEKIFTATVEDLVEIDGFGQIMANAVVKYFSHEDNIAMVRQTLTLLNIQKTIAATGGKLDNMVFAVTGTLTIYESRKALQSYIESKGGKVGSSVTGKTNYLINNDTTSNSSKNKKARELNVEIISEEEFDRRF